MNNRNSQSAAQSTCIELGARLDIVQAVDLQRTFAAALASGGPILLDGGRVEQIDTAILQLLVSLWRSGRERGIACRWRGASDALRSTANLLGLAEMLDFPDGRSVQGRDHAAA